MYLHNNLKFDINIQHTIGDVQYPRGWFLDAANRATIGVTEVPDPVKPDDNLFTSTENPDGTYTATARTAAEIAARAANAKAMLQANIVRLTQARLDAFAATRGYQSIHTAAAYALSKKVKYQREGQTAVDAMTDTWDVLYAVLAEVKEGTRPIPTGYAEIEPLLPVLTWPA